MKKESFKFTPLQREALRLMNGTSENVMLFGGSRSGKTFVLCANIALAAFRCNGLRAVILRRYQKDVRESILLDTFPRVLRLRYGMSQTQFERILCKSDLCIRPQNGSEIWFGGLDDKDRADKILGREFGLIYFNEVSQIPWNSVEIAKTRLAMKMKCWKNKCFYDCNPSVKSHWSYRIFIEKKLPDGTAINFPEDYVSLKMNPEDNKENLAEGYIEKTLGSLQGKTRSRFLLGNWVEENENALWKRETMINRYRLDKRPLELRRIVIGVDPAVTSSAQSDNTGIIVAGSGQFDGQTHYYILEDKSISASPARWASLVVEAYRRNLADCVIAEVNQGGDLVVSFLRNIDPALPVRTVHATRGKYIRAEPVAALYEQGLVHHIGEFPELEDEMTSFTGDDTADSPDRMDALVWAITDLSQSGSVKIGSYRFV